MSTRQRDNRNFLIPWLVCVSVATFLDIFLCFYFTAKDTSDPFHTVLFITDFIFSALNVSVLHTVRDFPVPGIHGGKGQARRLPKDREASPKVLPHCKLLQFIQFLFLFLLPPLFPTVPRVKGKQACIFIKNSSPQNNYKDVLSTI
ncbi:hypothetical protein CDAR_82341 [Caerostris darwini]|uniref:Uncharacterized protein n=1 Tax=Caerostris darwini TaxID=1538125 RepID=A0AAV4QAR8_9ARAC|nr:hypothetical protein CDAR_82341 [Caerostris darwini]